MTDSVTGTGSIEIAVVLVEPARGGNVGSVARAMKTMGFSDLRLVAGAHAPWETGEARAYAHGSREILEGATIHSTLQEATRDRDLVVGTTARRRGTRDDYYDPASLRQMLTHGERGERIAIVFGREESGLSNSELELCQITTAIPMRAAYPSLNLAQAVMVYCYELAPLLFQVNNPEQGVPREATVRVLHERTADILTGLGFDPGRALYHRILERVGSARRGDAHLMLSVINALEKRLPRGGLKEPD